MIVHIYVVRIYICESLYILLIDDDRLMFNGLGMGLLDNLVFNKR